jgi:predicted transcriptional regulator
MRDTSKPVVEAVMKVGDICRRAVVAIDNGMDVIAAAELMRQQHVGLPGKSIRPYSQSTMS